MLIKKTITVVNFATGKPYQDDMRELRKISFDDYKVTRLYSCEIRLE